MSLSATALQTMQSVGTKIYVGNLPDRAQPEEIKKHFSKIGNVVNMELKGNYGFIEFEERRMCDEAITQLHGSEFQGSQLRVEYAYGETKTSVYKYRATDICFKCGQVGHWARECTSSFTNGRGLNTRKTNNRYDDRRITDTFIREPYNLRDGRSKYDRGDERYLPPPTLDRNYDRLPYDRYARESELDYRREYRGTYDRGGYERERDRPYDRTYTDRNYERYSRDPYDRVYYPPPRDGYEREGYERRPLPPPDVAPYPARGKTGSPLPPRRPSYERPGIREAPLPSYRGRSPSPPPRFTDNLFAPPPPSLRPLSPRAGLYRRRSMSPLRSGRGPLPYTGRPRSPSPIGRPLPPRRDGGAGGPGTPTTPSRR
ncbi:12574_t:CDS:2 [Ambispora leptoticha]|uniref:12574_t:CDS:1 n=1 Tax=Ambispora leptoticha TaxID=144679 RepID=A0A9N9B064_9GLOM|nr:12574_t:CDS:2 [Ambispora leptoticha]